jgi:hypothetical protein
MDNTARVRQRMLAVFLQVTAVLYVSAEALNPKGTDQVITATGTALKVLPIAAGHSARLYLSGSLTVLALGGLAVSYAAIAMLVRERGWVIATVAALLGAVGCLLRRTAQRPGRVNLAAFLPCIAALPSGWTTALGQIASGKASFALDAGPAGLQTVTITLTATCDTAGARQIPSGQPGIRQLERPLSPVPRHSDIRYYTFPGGCATYQFVSTPGASGALATAVDHAVAFMPRWALVRYIRRTEGLALCGRGATCPR